MLSVFFLLLFFLLFKLKNNKKFKRANSTALGMMVQMIPPFVVLVFVVIFGTSKADIDN